MNRNQLKDQLKKCALGIVSSAWSNELNLILNNEDARGRVHIWKNNITFDGFSSIYLEDGRWLSKDNNLTGMVRKKAEKILGNNPIRHRGWGTTVRKRTKGGISETKGGTEITLRGGHDVMSYSEEFSASHGKNGTIIGYTHESSDSIVENEKGVLTVVLYPPGEELKDSATRFTMCVFTIIGNAHVIQEYTQQLKDNPDPDGLAELLKLAFNENEGNECRGDALVDYFKQWFDPRGFFFVYNPTYKEIPGLEVKKSGGFFGLFRK